jgi:hypothetical protein
MMLKHFFVLQVAKLFLGGRGVTRTSTSGKLMLYWSALVQWIPHIPQEATVCKVIAAISLGLLLIVGAGTVPAQSGDVTFKLTDKARFSIIRGN